MKRIYVSNKNHKRMELLKAMFNKPHFDAVLEMLIDQFVLVESVDLPEATGTD